MQILLVLKRQQTDQRVIPTRYLPSSGQLLDSFRTRSFATYLGKHMHIYPSSGMLIFVVHIRECFLP